MAVDDEAEGGGRRGEGLCGTSLQVLLAAAARWQGKGRPFIGEVAATAAMTMTAWAFTEGRGAWYGRWG